MRANILSLGGNQRNDTMDKGLLLRKRLREEEKNNGDEENQEEFITKRARQDHGMGKNLKCILTKMSSNQSPEKVQELEKRIIEALQELKLANSLQQLKLTKSTPASY